MPGKELEVTKQKSERQYNKLFGPHVRQLRQERYPDVTIADFAESVGITGPYLSNIENCKVPPPSDVVVKAIAEKLEVDSDSLLAMAGYLDPELALHLNPLDKDARNVLKFLRFMRGKLSGSNKYTMEELAAYLIGRVLEERRKLTNKELYPEMLEQAIYLAQHDDQFSDEFQPTIDRGMRVLGLLQEKLDAELEEKEHQEDAKKAKQK